MTNWVAVDFETANEYRGSPCAVSLVTVANGHVTGQMTTLIQPPPSCAHFSPFCVSLHGITADDVVDAPEWPDALAKMMNFIDGRTVVAHNAAFDVGVIRDACDEMGLPWPTLTYACSLVVARRTWPLLSYSLPWVAAEVGHDLGRHHDPTADARAAAAVMTEATKVHGAATLTELLNGLRIRLGSVAHGTWTGCYHLGALRSQSMLPGANPNADPSGPLYGLTVAFTGALASMTRSQAWSLVAEAGGQPLVGVSKKTDLLVMGEQDPRKLVPGSAMSSKQQKAANLLQAGHTIEVIAEPDFLRRLAATEGIHLGSLRPNP